MKSMTSSLILAGMVSLAACVHASAIDATRSSGYALATAYPLPGSGRWDLLALDSQRHHLFVSRGDRVQVMDTRDGRLVGTLPGTDGVHGIAMAPGLARGFTTNGHANTLTEFDLATLRPIRTVDVAGQSPDAALFDPFSGRLFVFNAHSNNVSVIDPVKGQEVATIAFDGNPELATSDGRGRVFVNIEDKAQVAVIDTGSMQLAHTWLLPGCEGPTGIALDIAHARLFSACQNGIMAVTDADNGHQVARVAIGEGPDGLAFDSRTYTVFSPNGKSGTLTVVHEDDPAHFSIVQTLTTQRSARTLVLDPDTHMLYMPAASFEPQPANSRERPTLTPGSFRILVVARSGTATH